MKTNSVTFTVTLSDQVRNDFHKESVTIDLPYDESRMLAKETVDSLLGSLSAVLTNYNPTTNLSNIP